MTLKNKFVLVTGASTGIGRAIAIEFGREGATVGLVARRITELEKTKEMVMEMGGEAEIFAADLSDLGSVNKLIEDIKEETDHVDILVNVAGIWHGVDEVYAGRDLEDFDQGTILDTYMVGFTSPTLLVHGLIDELARAKGAILNISGTFENAAVGWLPYYASKRGLEDLTIGLSEELKRLGINVNCISPSDVATEEYKKYFPEDAIGANTPEQVAKLALRICKKKVTGKFWKIKNGVVTLDGYHK